MMVKRLATISAAAAVLIAVSGCNSQCFDKKYDLGTPRDQITISKAPGKIKLDGILEENEWKGAEIYSLNRTEQYHSELTNPPKVMENIFADPYQGGTYRIMYDDEYFYIGADLVDVDVMQYGDENQSHFYTTGDTLEIFLKPANSPRYWECYGTPNAKKTSLYFETRGYPLHKDRSVLMDGIDNAVKVHGTLNNYNDTDKGWTIEMKIPRKELAKAGVDFKPGEAWTILVARYNYTYGSKRGYVQFSTSPELPIVHFHHLEYYGELVWK